MQGISVYKKSDRKQVLYHAYHERNGEYLERENEADRFLVLGQVDDVDPNGFYTSEDLNRLMCDLDIVITEANSHDDIELSNHLKEVMVLCKLCLWNEGQYVLIMSPFEFIPADKYPLGLPENYKFNIASAGLKGK